MVAENSLTTPTLQPEPSRLEIERTWRAAKYFNLYRLTLSALFVVFFYSPLLHLLGSYSPLLFQITSLTYLGIAVIAVFVIQGRWLGFEVLSYSLTLIDIMALILLMRASGGIESGLGMLIVVAIAGNSLIMSSQASNLFAAIAALAILGEQVFAQVDPNLEPSFTIAGILGAALFATAFLAHVLSTRIRESEALARQRGVDLANLAQLNQHVLQRMQSGIIVVDAGGRIRLMNDSAWNMLGLPGIGGGSNKDLDSVSPELSSQLTAWHEGRLLEPRTFKPTGGTVELLPNFTALGTDTSSGTLIFLEDTVRMAQQAQQMKLASLGQLTASIAHEIRNPLGAISHAEQLLAESAGELPGNQRLLEIIHTNTSRVNNIIENVLQLSRRERSMPERIRLKDWLNNFVTEFCQSQNCPTNDITITVDPPDTTIFLDATHLHQVLWNLCQNGLRYSVENLDQARLQLIGGYMPNSKKPFLDVIDNGPGVDPSISQHIFEPFFTTGASGSGLGLYISSELCSFNNAKLSYIPIPTGGSCFRIEFSESPQKNKPEAIESTA
jgi:two-component system sensor histidine kinase PilS (NtrC family)